MTGRRVAITGIGIVSSLGVTREATWARMLEGACGIGPVSAFDVAIAVRSQEKSRCRSWHRFLAMAVAALVTLGSLVCSPPTKLWRTRGC